MCSSNHLLNEFFFSSRPHPFTRQLFFLSTDFENSFLASRVARDAEAKPCNFLIVRLTWRRPKSKGAPGGRPPRILNNLSARRRNNFSMAFLNSTALAIYPPPQVPDYVPATLSSGEALKVPLGNVKENLAEELAAFHLALSGGGIFQRERGINHRAEFPAAEELQSFEQFPLATHERPEDGAPAAIEQAQVELYFFAAGRAASYQAPISRHSLEARIPDGRADVLEDHVHAALFGNAADFLSEVLFGMVDDEIGAERAGLFE